MHPYTLFRDEQCGKKDFYGDLRHPIAEYFSSASIMPCSVSGNKIGILMTVADKYTEDGDWSDGNAKSPFNFPLREGQRRLCFLGGKRQYAAPGVPERPHQTALREFKEQAGAVPERLIRGLQPHGGQKVVWLGSAKMVVFKAEEERDGEFRALASGPGGFARDVRFESSINHVGLEWVTFTVEEAEPLRRAPPHSK